MLKIFRNIYYYWKEYYENLVEIKNAKINYLTKLEMRTTNIPNALFGLTDIIDLFLGNCIYPFYLAIQKPINIGGKLRRLKKIKKLQIFGIIFNKLPNSIIVLEMGWVNETPSCIFGLENLQELSISSVNKISYDENNFKIFNLEKLCIFQTKFESLSFPLGKLQKITIIDINNSKLKYIPQDIGELENLEFLLLQFNQIEYLPKSIYNLKKLKKIDLRSNPTSLKEIEELRKNMPNVEVLF